MNESCCRAGAGTQPLRRIILRHTETAAFASARLFRRMGIIKMTGLKNHVG
ncbi:MAG: hypothetical protein ACYDHY_00140 [Acidiferrobacterales bacterium]